VSRFRAKKKMPRWYVHAVPSPTCTQKGTESFFARHEFSAKYKKIQYRGNDTTSIIIEDESGCAGRDNRRGPVA
jgi:hypothetical protein